MVTPLLWIGLRAAAVDPSRAAAILFRSRSLEIAANSLLLMAGVTVLSVIIGVPLAWLTVRSDLPFARFWTVVVALPLAIPSYLGALAYIDAFGPRGRLQSLLAPLGVDSLPEIYGLGGAILVITLYTYPYVYLTTRAALKTFDKTLVDAARTLEHDYRETFRRVTFPQIRPAITAGALLVALYAISDFGTPAFMRLDVFTRQIYVEYRGWNLDYAAMLSIQLIAVTVFILALESRIRGDERVYTDSGGGSGGNHVVELGRWRWPATGLCLLVALATLALPVVVFASWLVGGATSDVDAYRFQFEYAVNSAGVSTAAAVLAALAALPVAYLAARYRTLLGHLFERATYVGYAVPGIVIGLALVFFGANYAGVVYQALPLLVFAYVVRFMPQAVGSTRTSILQVDPKLTEAARTLGRGDLETFRSVTLPLIAPGIVAGAALVFLTTMKELPATLLLRPTGFDTLVTHIWRAEQAAYMSHAAVPAFVILLVSGLSMWIILRQEDV
ncbi:ABC transporter permease [Natrialbaceae archaeon AArc-T1-2]|uniref:ABC transporter permease n=1 Tax=Natrialbaceae archaeon AArc-T1-2 TaxID=3053904 RepID=UPI00255AE503|nr:iron ABC transporter permease [Natrialbaceae archaeon AArc-T1-2]WIV68685.1 iron ABC transporter permease [Natrialbaceae archaeon AArc-T1-2]